MKRLVYAPQVNAWVKTDTGIFDLSPYITNFNISRKVNAASTAELTFRNPKVEQVDGQNRYLFTQHQTVETNGDISYGPMFHPMDPIIITLTRLKGHPVQVFTGYCDAAPYVQLFPGLANLTATCTLKRLMYTYWDPGLPVVTKFLEKNGWITTPEGQTVNAAAEEQTLENHGLLDSSIGKLLYNVLTEIGGWDHDDIFIQALPGSQISAAVKAIYEDLTGEAKASFEIFADFLDKIVGYGSLGGGAVGTASTPPSGGGGQPASVGYPLSVRGTLGSTVADHKNRPLGNWQSDNAIDISVPVGTSVFAVDDGTITRVAGSYSTGAGQTEGLRFTLVTNDNKWFYQHNSQRFVTEGQKVKKGDLLAKTGSGNSIPHLHLGSERGDPQQLLGL